MNRSLLLAGLLLLGSGLTSPTWAARVFIEVPGKGMLAVVVEKPAVDKVYAVDPPGMAGDRDWNLVVHTDRPVEIGLAERNRGYLAVDPRTGEVGLSSQQGPAAEWKLTQGKEGYTIQATAGKYKG